MPAERRTLADCLVKLTGSSMTSRSTRSMLVIHVLLKRPATATVRAVRETRIRSLADAAASMAADAELATTSPPSSPPGSTPPPRSWST